MRVKISVNDINMQFPLHAERVDIVMGVVGIKPQGDWISAKDVGKTLTGAYYSLTIDREYEWDDVPERLKEIAMGLEYVRAESPIPANPRPTPSLSLEGSTYVKACDVDVYVHKKGFLGGWFKVYSRSLAKQRKIPREELLSSSIRLVQKITSELSKDGRRKLAAVEDRILMNITSKSQP